MSETGECQHAVKFRLLGSDPRLWACRGNNTLSVADPGCGGLFVFGRPSHGEDPWIPTGVNHVDTFCCAWCLDGFCTSLDSKPCPQCGTTSARVAVTA